MSSTLQSYQLNEIREAFDIFDRDKSGSISVKEMERVFKSLGIQASREEIRLVVKEMDIDGDGEISFEEFVRVMGDKFYRRYTSSEIKAAFKHFDKDNNGFITCEELKECMAKMGKHFSDREINRMIRSIDRDGNGMISIEEFAQLLE
ncbi:Calmodulin [Brachionus plicatilis]|uniref:Calmodulin n=1 Tax=Brachionus plicatilis TaxID=10195 RepID=A0A3M7R9U2_BRAPC|nr:Calmodulin [Brachionus plicatilis]